MIKKPLRFIILNKLLVLFIVACIKRNNDINEEKIIHYIIENQKGSL